MSNYSDSAVAGATYELQPRLFRVQFSTESFDTNNQKRLVMFVPGEFYYSPIKYLLVFPSVEKAMAGHYLDDSPNGFSAKGTSFRPSENYMRYWSKYLECDIKCSAPKDIMMFLEEKKRSRGLKCLRFLFSDFEGWMVESSYLLLEKYPNRDSNPKEV